MQPPAAGAEGSGSPLYGAGTFSPFKFHPSVESVDWSCLRAVDVDRVVQELDVATLQENLTIITFCSLEREACSRCGQPVDAGLLKVLRLAQLTIQHLLHRQDCLSANVAKLEAQLQGLGQELDSQTGLLMGVRKECHRRKRMINLLQQLVQQTGAHTYHMCRLCDEIFMNTTFMWGHIQKKHDIMFKGGKEKRQSRPVHMRLTELRTKLRWSPRGLATQREAEKQLENQMDMKRRCPELQILCTRASSLEEKCDEHARKLQEIRETMKLQEREWKEKIRQVEEMYTAKKRELQEERERQPSFLSQGRGELGSQRRMYALFARLQERAELMASQKEKLQEERARLSSPLLQGRGELADQDHLHRIYAFCARLQERAELKASQRKKIQNRGLRNEEGAHQAPKALETDEDYSQEAQRQPSPEDSQKTESEVKTLHGALPSRTRGPYVQAMVNILEEKLHINVKKPDGGVRLLFPSNTGPPRAAVPGVNPQLQEERERQISSLSEERGELACQDDQAELMDSQEEKIQTESLKKEEETDQEPRTVETEEDSSQEVQRQPSPVDNEKAQLRNVGTVAERKPPTKPPQWWLCSHDSVLTQEPSNPLDTEPQEQSSTSTIRGHGGSLEADLEGESAQLVSAELSLNTMGPHEGDTLANRTSSVESQTSPFNAKSMQSDTKIIHGDSVVKKQPPPKPPRRKLCRQDPGLTQEISSPLQPELLDLSSSPATPKHGGSLEANLEGKGAQLVSSEPRGTMMVVQEGDALASMTSAAQSQASPSNGESIQSDTRITHGVSVVKKQPPPKPPRRKLCRQDPGLIQETRIPLGPELLDVSSTPTAPEHEGSLEVNLKGEAAQLVSREPHGTIIVFQEGDASASMTSAAQSQASPSVAESTQSDTSFTHGHLVVRKLPPPKPPRRKLCGHDPSLTQDPSSPLRPVVPGLSSTTATPEHGGSSEAQLEEKAAQMDSVDTGNVTTRMDTEDGDKLELSGIGRSAGSPRVLPGHRVGRRHTPRLKGRWVHRILKWWRNT